MMEWKTDLYTRKHSFVYGFGESLVDLLQANRKEEVLDLGCGSGELTHKISEVAKKVIGMDSSEEMIENAKSKFETIEFILGDATNFQFGEKKFDAIFSNAVLHWITSPEKPIHCMYETLRKGGRIVLEFGGKGNVQNILKELRKSLKDRGYTKLSDLEIWYFPSIGEYSTLLEKQGFFVTFAEHFDRWTELVDEKNGIQDWLSMFAPSLLGGIKPEETEEIKKEVQENLKTTNFQNGKWYADYKRIRIKAIKP